MIERSDDAPNIYPADSATLCPDGLLRAFANQFAAAAGTRCWSFDEPRRIPCPLLHRQARFHIGTRRFQPRGRSGGGCVAHVRARRQPLLFRSGQSNAALRFHARHFGRHFFLPGAAAACPQRHQGSVRCASRGPDVAGADLFHRPLRLDLAGAGAPGGRRTHRLRTRLLHAGRLSAAAGRLPSARHRRRNATAAVLGHQAATGVQ